jgi:D-alanine-D-alanine ligase
MLRVLVLFGGRSSEHEISCKSAYNVLHFIDKKKYDVTVIGITKEGEWYLYTDSTEKMKNFSWSEGKDTMKRAFLLPDLGLRSVAIVDEEGISYQKIDVCIPVLHGKNGEDGTVQGLLTLAGIPYVGPHVCASAICMNKVYANMVFDYEGISQAKWIYFKSAQIKNQPDQAVVKIEQELGYPCVIKPANAGSSIGVTIVQNREMLSDALNLAMEHDDFILVEECIKGREVECAVLGNDNPIASGVGEIVSPEGFYDYEEKYIKATTALLIPAPLPEAITKEIRETARKAYQGADCRGLSRIDFFVRESDQKVMLNEINTLPGFTDISMYPRLFEAAGLSQTELIDQLILYALEN